MIYVRTYQVMPHSCEQKRPQPGSAHIFTAACLDDMNSAIYMCAPRQHPALLDGCYALEREDVSKKF
jgi:hypothetical protein